MRQLVGGFDPSLRTFTSDGSSPSGRSESETASLLTGERVLKLIRLSSVKPPFFQPLAAKGGERVEEWTGGGSLGVF